MINQFPDRKLVSVDRYLNRLYEIGVNTVVAFSFHQVYQLLYRNAIVYIGFGLSGSKPFMKEYEQR